jgi:hypothetical protein
VVDANHANLRQGATHKAITLDVDLIANVKQMIQSKESIPVAQERLIFADNQLEGTHGRTFRLVDARIYATGIPVGILLGIVYETDSGQHGPMAQHLLEEICVDNQGTLGAVGRSFGQDKAEVLDGELRMSQI